MQSLQIKAETDPLRLAAANRAVDEGDIRVACLIYTRLALSHRSSSVTEEARQRLLQLQEQARRELSSIDAMLADVASSPSKISALTPIVSTGQILEPFQKYDRLARKYRHLGGVGGDKGEIARHIAKKRREYSFLLKDAEAETLWELGQQYEEQGHLCCAFLVYEQATTLSSPSAQLARKRFEEMNQDPRIVASSKTCRDVQWCLENYIRAEQQLAEGRRDLANAQYRQILRRAPMDSEVYDAAREQLAKTR